MIFRFFFWNSIEVTLVKSCFHVMQLLFSEKKFFFFEFVLISFRKKKASCIVSNRKKTSKFFVTKKIIEFTNIQFSDLSFQGIGTVFRLCVNNEKYTFFKIVYGFSRTFGIAPSTKSRLTFFEYIIIISLFLWKLFHQGCSYSHTIFLPKLGEKL